MYIRCNVFFFEKYVIQMVFKKTKKGNANV